MTKERPILFSAPMVRAILEGRKTQTRRVVKRPKDCPENYMLRPDGIIDPGVTWWQSPMPRVGRSQECPYGKPGDRLWVRESWCPANSDNGPCVLYPADHDRRYLADESFPVDYSKFPAGRGAWTAWASDVEGGTTKAYRPSIHMPRWASRIDLLITDVRVERLQDISGEDAIAEGIDYFYAGLFRDYSQPGDIGIDSPVGSFESLWQKINGAGSWSANPFVWVVEFKRLERGAA